MLDCSYLFDFFRNSYSYLSYFNKSGKALSPFRYSFEITYQCNLQCPYCYIGQERNKKELTTKELIDLIEQVPSYAIISLYGGEPIIRTDFLEIFEKAAKQTYGKVNIVTNGSLLNESIIDNFIKNKLLLLSISLDGYGKTHDQNRAKEGLFDQVYSNLELIKSKRKTNRPMLDIKTIILDNNLDDLPKIYQLCTNMGFNFFSLAFKRNHTLKQNACLRDSFGEEFYAQEYPIEPYFDIEHFNEIYKELMSIAKHSNTKLRWAPKFKPTGDISKIKDLFSKGNTPITEIYKPCLMPFSSLFINPEGDVYPCLSLKAGNVKGKKISEVYNSAQFKCFRKNLKESKLFNSCQLCCELVPKNL